MLTLTPSHTSGLGHFLDLSLDCIVKDSPDITDITCMISFLPIGQDKMHDNATDDDHSYGYGHGQSQTGQAYHLLHHLPHAARHRHRGQLLVVVLTSSYAHTNTVPLQLSSSSPPSSK